MGLMSRPLQDSTRGGHFIHQQRDLFFCAKMPWRIWHRRIWHNRGSSKCTSLSAGHDSRTFGSKDALVRSSYLNSLQIAEIMGRTFFVLFFAFRTLALGKPSCNVRDEKCFQGSLFLQRETLSKISQMAAEDSAVKPASLAIEALSSELSKRVLTQLPKLAINKLPVSSASTGTCSKAEPLCHLQEIFETYGVANVQANRTRAADARFLMRAAWPCLASLVCHGFLGGSAFPACR